MQDLSAFIHRFQSPLIEVRKRNPKKLRKITGKRLIPKPIERIETNNFQTWKTKFIKEPLIALKKQKPLRHVLKINVKQNREYYVSVINKYIKNKTEKFYKTIRAKEIAKYGKAARRTNFSHALIDSASERKSMIVRLYNRDNRNSSEKFENTLAILNQGEAERDMEMSRMSNLFTRKDTHEDVRTFSWIYPDELHKLDERSSVSEHVDKSKEVVFQLDDVTEDLDAELENTRKLLGLSIEEFDALDDMTNTIDDRFSVFDMFNQILGGDAEDEIITSEDDTDDDVRLSHFELQLEAEEDVRYNAESDVRLSYLDGTSMAGIF